MGEVFRAVDQQLGRQVAVKLLLPSDRDPRAAERFQREARAAAMLSDPHLVAVYDFGHHGDGFFLVMELVEGRSVADELAEQGPLPKDRAIDIVEQSAQGLAAAHREDVVHRDVKPSNLLMTIDGTVKVADFGIAHLPGDGATTLTATGQIIGSAHYLAPERARGGQAGKAADVYSLGCVLYQLVTGVPPFTAEVPTAILYQHVDAAPKRPSLTRPELSGPFETVLLEMLAKNPADRPSAAEIAAGRLRALPLAGDSGRTAAVPVTVISEPAAGAIATSPLEAVERPNRSGRTAALAGLIALLVATTAVLTGVLLNGVGTKPPPATDVGPQPGVSPSTAASKPTATPSTTGPTRPPANQPKRITSAPPSPSASEQGTPTPSAPSSSTPSASATSPSTPSPSAPAQSSIPTQATPSTSPSSTPPPNTTTPPTETPSPGPQGNAGP